MAKLELTNMVMVQDPETGKVLVQERVKSWQGIAFPGGHVEDGESIYDSAVREIKEETGLTIRHLTPRGFMYWFNNQTGDRYFTYFFVTSDFSGEMLESTEEGKVFWVDYNKLPTMNLSPNMANYLPIIEGKYSEGFSSWNNDEPYVIQYR